MFPRPRPQRRKPEPTIALINIVFLLLVFFMIAGQISPPLDDTVSLVRTTELGSRQPPDAAVINADGRVFYRGKEVAPADYPALIESSPDKSVRLIPDRDLPATILVGIVRDFGQQGAGPIWVVTERGLK